MNFALAFFSSVCLLTVGNMMVWQELVRKEELGVRRIGAGEVELGNQIRPQPRSSSVLLRSAGTRPHATPVLGTLRVTLLPSAPSESSDLEIRSLLLLIHSTNLQILMVNLLVMMNTRKCSPS